MRFTYSPLNSVVIAAAILAGVSALRSLLAGDLPWGELATLAGVSGAIGMVGATWRAPRLATLAVQVVGLAATLLHHASMLYGRGPHVSSATELTQLGIATFRQGTAPITVSPGVEWIILLSTAVLLVVTEVLVNVVEHPGWSLAPITVHYAITALAVTRELPYGSFLPVVLGYGIVLISTTGFLNHRANSRLEHITYVGTRLISSLLALLLAAGLVGVLAPSIPLGTKPPWAHHRASRPIELNDPTVTLSESLHRDKNRPVLSYTTDTGDPVYLRLVALTQLTDNGARLTPMTLSTNGLRDAYRPEGTRKAVSATITMYTPSEYVPAPFAVSAIDGAGEWSYVADTLSIIVTGEDGPESTVNLTYRTRSTVPAPSSDEIRAAEAGTPPDATENLQLPATLDSKVSELAQKIGSQASTAGAQALAVQQYLRSDQFTYSLDVSHAAGGQALTTFLLSTHRGYCIHFATAMVTMMRALDVPARLVIGFTPGTATGDHYTVSTHDMHAWVEVHLAGLGWVPFDPTPSVVTAETQTSPSPSQLAPSSSPSATPSPSVVPTPAPSPKPTASAKPPNPTPLIGVGIGLLLLALLAAPASIRALQRQQRLRAGQSSPQLADGVWAEVRDTMLDCRLSWVPGSPIGAAAVMSDALPPAAAHLLQQIATTVERVRYARGSADTDDLAHQVHGFRREMLTAMGHKKFLSLAAPSSLVASFR